MISGVPERHYQKASQLAMKQRAKKLLAALMESQDITESMRQKYFDAKISPTVINCLI